MADLQAIGRQRPKGINLMVAGPLFHGAWPRENVSKLESIPLGQDTSRKAWPPPSEPTRLHLHADGTLSFTAPGTAEAGAHRDYVSDSANPWSRPSRADSR